MSSTFQLTTVILLANVASMAGSSIFAALAPVFAEAWQLTNTEIGWITGMYYGGYATVVAVLVALTDRVDARGIHIASAVIGGLAFIAFAWLAGGFWSALVCHAVAGIGLAGTYMPGLKMLTDRLDGQAKLRAVPYYTQGFSLGIALSFFLGGLIEPLAGWRMAFFVAGCGNLLCALLVIFGVAAKPVPAGAAPSRNLLDFRPVLKNRAAMGFTLGYAGHSYELMAIRGWLVVFLGFAESLQPEGSRGWNLTTIAAIAVIAGMPATIIGAELSLKHGRKRVVSWVMAITVVVALATGASASLPFMLVIAFAIAYNVIVMGDSAALTAGAVAGARPGEQGATLAVHSLLGFAASFAGPLAVGAALDAMGGTANGTAWVCAFAVMGAGSAAGLLFVRWVAPSAPGNSGRGPNSAAPAPAPSDEPDRQRRGT